MFADFGGLFRNMDKLNAAFHHLLLRLVMVFSVFYLKGNTLISTKRIDRIGAFKFVKDLTYVYKSIIYVQSVRWRLGNYIPTPKTTLTVSLIVKKFKKLLFK